MGGLSCLPPLLLLLVMCVPLPLYFFLGLDFLSGRSLDLLRALVLGGLVRELRHFMIFLPQNYQLP